VARFGEEEARLGVVDRWSIDRSITGTVAVLLAGGLARAPRHGAVRFGRYGLRTET